MLKWCCRLKPVGTISIKDYLIFMNVRLHNALRHLVRHERIAAESEHVSAANTHHLGDETVQETVQTTFLQHQTRDQYSDVLESTRIYARYTGY